MLQMPVASCAWVGFGGGDTSQGCVGYDEEEVFPEDGSVDYFEPPDSVLC